MLAKINSSAVVGVDAYPVTVEVDIAAGLPSFSIVGLPDAAVKESKDRVVAAVRNSGFDFPSKRVTVNLAPADIKKEGASFDLAIAVGVLRARKLIDAEPDGFCFIGELALDGAVRPVKGVLPIVLSLKDSGIRKVMVPKANLGEAMVAGDIDVYPVEKLKDVSDFLCGKKEIKPFSGGYEACGREKEEYDVDFSEVKGQQFVKRALEIAAAGGHNVLMVGPPGSGKSMLARRLPTILPDLHFEESLETTKIHSVVGLVSPGQGLIKKRPFRAPHHTVSDIALIGGGTYPRPGDVSLAHNGVLFLDELPEFHRDVLEVLRQPLEDRVVTVSRAKGSVAYPASFMFIGAMNPCPCGNFGHPERECLCGPYKIRKYVSRISGPLMDRIDIHVEVPSLKITELARDFGEAEPSSDIRKRVVMARQRQKERLEGDKIYCNSRMGTRHIRKYCALDKESKDFLIAVIERLRLSARAYDRILKVARTIADLARKEEIEREHVAEAAQYRRMDAYLA
ncbi:MAG: YifB family Mg chelatase-like AAA ATPase [Endomicrobiales bacterium]|nr:YifB family Mg chelatase-like AAA ATPase [Endomicrobiales bacterium]